MAANFIESFIRRNPLQLAIQITTVFLFVLNIWLSVKLFPIVSDIIELKVQVNAMQVKVDKNSEFVEENYSTVDQITQLRSDIKEVKESTIRLEGKVDRLIERLSTTR